MKPTTRAAVTAAAAAVVAAGGYFGTRYLAIAVLVLIIVTAWGWPTLLHGPHPWATRWIVGIGGAVALVAVVLGRNEPYLRYVVVVLAAMVMLAMASEIFFPSPRGRALTSIASIAAGSAIVTSGSAWVAANRTAGSEDLVLTASAALFVTSITSIMTKSVDVNTIISLVMGAGVGAGVGVYLAQVTWYAGGAVGLVSAVIVMLLAELVRREPQVRDTWAGIASGVAPVLSAGLLVYIGGRMLLG